MVIQRCFLSQHSKKAIIRVFLPMMLLAFSALLSSPLFADSVTASLNKTVSIENEIVQLTLRADFSDTGNGPDLTPLERDFTILGKSQNSQFSFNLGTSTALNFWVVNLMPKSVGTFEIPPIKIGDHSSQPIRLVIKNSPQLLDSNGNPPVIIKAETSDIEPYLQQEVIIRVELLTSVSLTNVNRSVPSHPDLVVERLSDDQMTYQNVNGTEYQVITREYLAFPQRSGLLMLPPQSIQAMVSTSTGRRMIKVQSEPLGLQVLPIPASYTGNAWLPSQGIKIDTRLRKTTESPRVGDTLIWTIDIKAKGALPEQILPVDFASTRDYKLYPSTPDFSTQKSSDGVVGQQSISIEVVPTTPGLLTLPDVRIDYWDTEIRALQTAVSKTAPIEIAPLPFADDSETNSSTSANESSPSMANPLPAQTRSVAPISLAKKTDTDNTTTNKNNSPSSNDLSHVTDDTKIVSHSLSVKEYAIIGFGLLALGSLAMWVFNAWTQRKARPEADLKVPTLEEFAALNTLDEQSAFEELVNCCRANNLAQLRPSLLEWARHRWGDSEIRGVEDIKRLTTVKVTQLLMEAELMMYSSNPAHEWYGAPLADALEEFYSGFAKPSQESQLKNLYPNF
ncbi:BatD family protein [Marinomonas algarum]|uniref:BatD family protein n=1 Tax=Marinomonas algarum TaxID=2883105 RepID=A0A9X1INV9_9GAMM|nr:BatD family protein [Marinomonas algarum]MCB5162407.1 BatD family protein [Marinomonas algarum]